MPFRPQGKPRSHEPVKDPTAAKKHRSKNILWKLLGRLLLIPQLQEDDNNNIIMHLHKLSNTITALSMQNLKTG